VGIRRSVVYLLRSDIGSLNVTLYESQLQPVSYEDDADPLILKIVYNGRVLTLMKLLSSETVTLQSAF
jgi:hypothetical protein